MASRSLGTLTLDLVARIGGFEQSMQKASRTTQQQMDHIAKGVGVAANAIVGLGTVAAGALTAVTISTVNTAKEVSQLSQVANASATDFQRMAAGANFMGVSSEKLADILKDVNDKTGEYLQTGGGELKDFFQNIAPQVGVTAEQFKNLSGPEALGLFFSSLEKANLSQADMTFYLEAVGNDLTSLLPLLRNGGAGFKLLGDQAEAAGAILDSDAIRSANELSAALYVMETATTGIKNQIATALLPTFKEMAGDLVSLSTKGGAASVVTGELAKGLRAVAAGAVGVVATAHLATKALGGLSELNKASQGEGNSFFENYLPPVRLYRLYQNFGKVKETLADSVAGIDETAQAYGTALERIFNYGMGTNPTSPGQTLVDQIAALYDQIDNRNRGRAAGNGTGTAKAYNESADVKLLDTLREQEAVLNAQSVLIDGQTGKVLELGQNAQALAKWEQQLADIKAKQVLTADQKALLASADQITAQFKKNAALEREVTLRKQAVEEAAKLQAFTANLNAQLATDEASQATSIASIGMGSKGAQRFQEMAALRQQYQQQQDALLAQRNSGDITQELYEKETLALRDALDKRLAMQEDYYRQTDVALGDWTNGAKAAYEDYLDSAADIAGQTQSLFSDAFNGAEDALTNFVKTGKLSFKDLADSIVSDLIRIQIRKMLAGAISAAGSTSWGAGIVSAFQADGGAWMNGVQMFANGGAFTNGVVTKPTAFGMAGGVGVMGEAGPEAIMPLTRGADGSLGVKAMGALSGESMQPAAASLSMTVPQTFHINGDVSPETIRLIEQMGTRSVETAYKTVLKDFQRNGPARQMLRKG
ncbi:lambda family phage tail tape measure protein [Pseudomonas psychrotolerans L19]|nr:lambda family phage tail tape measure protein [Pseudomonas psychrotolerans L19]